MNSKQKMWAVGGAVALLVIILIAAFFFKASKSDTNNGEDLSNQEVSTNEPIDIVSDFFGLWLAAAQSTSTDPYTSGVATSPILSAALKAKLEAVRVSEASEPDPVLCQAGFPERIKSKVVFEVEDKAQILVKVSDADQSVVTLLRHNDGWYINDIECFSGDAAPVREFSFDNEGFVLKGAPPHLDPNYWYVVFEENNEPGHSVPLIFNGESACGPAEGTLAACNPDGFLPVSKAHVYGQMGDAGIEVKRLEFLE